MCSDKKIKSTFALLKLVSTFYVLLGLERDSIICRARYMLSPNRLSVCLSVTRVDQSKKVEVTIKKFSTYTSSISLVFAGASFIQKF